MQVHEGDLDVKGHFDFSEGELMVVGNLTIAGTLSGDETGSLIVTGTLTCQNLFMEGNLDVNEGEIKEVAFGFYEAGISNFQTVKGNALILGNHCFEGDENGFENVFMFGNYGGELHTGSLDDLKTLITDDAFAILANIIGVGEEDNDDESYWNSRFLRDGILR